MKALLFLVGLSVSIAVAQAQSSFTVMLSGAEEFPANNSPATGSGTLTLNPNNSLTYNITYSGLSGDWSANHIHGPAGRGTNASVIFTLNHTPSGSTHAGTLSGTTPILTAPQISALQNEFWYVNIHSTPNFAGGEIRGQIVPVPEPSTLALLGLGAGSVGWWIRRRRRN